MQVEIVNIYADGHDCSSVVEVDEPSIPDFEEGDGQWWEDIIYPFTGCEHDHESVTGSCYTATIIEADNELLVDQEYEWID